MSTKKVVLNVAITLSRSSCFAGMIVLQLILIGKIRTKRPASWLHMFSVQSLQKQYRPDTVLMLQQCYLPRKQRPAANSLRSYDRKCFSVYCSVSTALLLEARRPRPTSKCRAEGANTTAALAMLQNVRSNRPDNGKSSYLVMLYQAAARLLMDVRDHQPWTGRGSSHQLEAAATIYVSTGTTSTLYETR
jgi:hypothetical protein